MIVRVLEIKKRDPEADRFGEGVAGIATHFPATVSEATDEPDKLLAGVAGVFLNLMNDTKRGTWIGLLGGEDKPDSLAGHPRDNLR